MRDEREHAELAEAVRKMLPQALIAVVKNNGGKLTLPIRDIDATGTNWLEVSVEGANMIFTLRHKN